MELLNLSQLLISLLTLTLLEIILGIDNLVFISILSSRLPKHKQALARRIGLLLALFTRLFLLASALWLTTLTNPLFTVLSFAISGRDIFLIAGGIFLLYKATQEIHTEFEGEDSLEPQHKSARFSLVVTQIAVLDIIFSLDSVLTAVGMTQSFTIMALAITLAIFMMIFASEPISAMINKYPTLKMLALSFLLLIGTVLIADGFHFEIPRGYIYFAISFSVLVEALNHMRIRIRKRRKTTAKN